MDIKLKPKEERPKCKGLIFRCRTNKYVSSYRSLEFKKSLRLLKQKSCKGCDQCEYIWDELYDYMLDTEGFMKDCKDGKMYKIIPEWIPGPYEYPDDGEMNYHLKEVKNE